MMGMGFRMEFDPRSRGEKMLEEQSRYFKAITRYAVKHELVKPEGWAVGCGGFGCVWKTTNPQIVIKATTDKEEVQVAALLRTEGPGRRPEGIVAYYHQGKALGATLLWREAANEVGLLPAHLAIQIDFYQPYAAYVKELFGDPGKESLAKWKKSVDVAARKLRDVSIELPSEPSPDTLNPVIMIDGKRRYLRSYLPDGVEPDDTDPYSFVLALKAARLGAKKLESVPELRLIGEAAIWAMDKGIVLADIRVPNIGRAWRGGQDVWVIVDPGFTLSADRSLPKGDRAVFWNPTMRDPTALVKSYLMLSPRPRSFRILSEQQWLSEVGESGADRLTGGVAAVTTPEGDILVRQGYEDSAVHEMLHASGFMPVGMSDFNNEGITQLVAQAICEQAGIPVRKTYSEEVSFAGRYIVPLTGLLLPDFAKGYARAEDKGRFVLELIWDRYGDKFTEEAGWSSGDRMKESLRKSFRQGIGTIPELEYLVDELGVTGSKRAKSNPTEHVSDEQIQQWIDSFASRIPDFAKLERTARDARIFVEMYKAAEAGGLEPEMKAAHEQLSAMAHDVRVQMPVQLMMLTRMFPHAWEMFMALVQQRKLPTALRRKVEAAVRSWDIRKHPSGRPTRKDWLGGYEGDVNAYLGRVEMIRDQLLTAREAFASSSITGAGGEASDVHMEAGPFTIVNSGGFSEQFMRSAADAIGQASVILERKGLGFVCYGEAHVVKQVARQAVLARYVGDTDTFLIRGFTRGSHEYVGTIIHELGHRLIEKFMTDAAKRLMVSLYRHQKTERYIRKLDLVMPHVGDTIQEHGKVYEVTGHKGVSILMRRKGTEKPVYRVSVESWVSAKADEAGEIPPKGFVNRYASKSPDENFCEMLRYYCMGKLPESQAALIEPVIEESRKR